MHHARLVSAHMTAIPDAISADTSLSEAHERMRALSVQQLPVVDQGRPSGVLLERDLLLAKQLNVDLGKISVRSVLPRAAFSVKADEPLASAVRSMASRAAACALVVDGAQVRGVLTMHDALRVLAELLEQEGSMMHSGIREIDLADRGELSLLDAELLLERASTSARRIMHGSAEVSDAQTLLHTLREILQARQALLLAEQRELAETLPDQLPLHRKHLEDLAEAHAHHVSALASVIADLSQQPDPPVVLVARAAQVVDALRTYLEGEREPLSFVS